MEYDALVNNNGVFGSLSSSIDTDEGIDLTDELLVEGCWVETTGGGEHIQVQPDIELVNGGSLVGKRWWIEPSTTATTITTSSSVKERLVVAVGYLKEYIKNTNILIQIWVPQRSNMYSRSSSFEFNHHHHHHLVTPTNVRFFRSQDYPRVHHQLQQYDVRGCLTLPVFQRGTATSLGVLQITSTTTNHNSSSLINYQQLLHNNNNLSMPLDHDVVDFRSCENFIPTSSVKVYDELYQGALNEIVQVLTSVCKTHNLPLALTWAPCIQQGKCGCGNSTSDQNYMYCVSTIDSACFVVDLDTLGFQEACSQYHLFRGQGIVGTAFTAAKPCFATDITAFSKAEYPLSPHANMFGLHAAFAIPLRSLYPASSDFVLELFLPKDCHDPEEQRHMLNSLSMQVQQGCRILHVVTEEEFTLPLPPPPHNKEEAHMIEKFLFASTLSSSQVESSSWIAHMMEAQQKGKGVSVSLEYQHEEPKEEFKVTRTWDGSNELLQAQTTQVFSDFTEQSSGSRSRASTVELGTGGGEESYSFNGKRSSSATTTTTTTTTNSGGERKTGDKRRTKAEKTISLPVLRQYFAGSLKDAAKSIGVCPTTLKRICRQHGITRWPSRKIKKVGHSLKKLQLVIDSVQGAEGAIQIGSFYTSFPELCSASARSDSSNKMHTDHSNTEYDNNNKNGFYNGDVCSQNFAASTMINNTNNIGGVDVLMMTESSPDHHHHHHHAFLNRELTMEEDTKLYFTRTKADPSGWRGALRVKATYGDEKIRFSLQPNWELRELQVEMTKRFKLNDLRNIDLKYMDDEGEWVVLACDGDLEECKELHRSSKGGTIRLSLFEASLVHNNNNHNNNNHSTTPSSSS